MSQLKTAEEIREMQQQLKDLATKKIKEYGDQLAGELMTGIILKIANTSNVESISFYFESGSNISKLKTIDEIKKSGNHRYIRKVIEFVINAFETVGYSVKAISDRSGTYCNITIAW